MTDRVDRTDSTPSPRATVPDNAPTATASPTTAPTTAPAVAPGPAVLTKRQILVILVGLMTGMLLAALDQSIVGTALPRIVSELGGLDQLSWVVTAYLLTSTAATPLWGKVSDLYGRRIIFQLAIGIFLVGSILAGLSQNMGQLIGFRALQGVGGGGLMSIAFAIIGDVIPPRERGRYQGYFGAVFGLSSVAGPLLGGFFTDGPGWRWIFYINIPLGLLALVVTSIVLRMPTNRTHRKIDYLGASVIVAGVSSLLLYLDWAGKEYGWLSPGPLALVAGTVAMAVAFVFVERRASEPIIPMRMFRNSVYSFGNAYAAAAGFTMFGGIVFFPLYLQAVKGLSPTLSGLAMVPSVIGIFSTSISSGQLISRYGRYKVFPILGGAILIVAMFLLSRLGVDTPFWQVFLFAFIFGAGLGLTMQTVVTAVQNSVDRRDMGVATSSTVFFRQVGGSVGTAAFGAVLSSRLDTHLQSQLGGAGAAGAAGGGGAPNVDANNIEALQHLAEPVKSVVLTAFSHSIDDVYLTALPFAVIALALAFFIKEIPLRTGRETPPPPPAGRPEPVAEVAAVAGD